MALSKKDNLYKDAMETCSQSGDRDLAEELLNFFVEQVLFSEFCFLFALSFLRTAQCLDHTKLTLPAVLVLIGRGSMQLSWDSQTVFVSPTRLHQDVEACMLSC